MQTRNAKALSILLILLLPPPSLNGQAFWRGVCLFGMPYAGSDKGLFFERLKNDLHVNMIQVRTFTGSPERHAFFLSPSQTDLSVIVQENNVLARYSSLRTTDADYANLMNGSLYPAIKAAASEIKPFAAVKRFYLCDEPTPQMYNAWGKVSSLLRDSMRIKSVAIVASGDTDLVNFARRCHPSEILIDPYFIQNNIPAPYYARAKDSLSCDSIGVARWTYEDYRFMSQWWIDKATGHWYRPAAEVSQEIGLDLIVTPQLHGYFWKKTGKYDSDRDIISTPCLRNPSASEIRLQFNLALAYGAKGFLAYPYATFVGTNETGDDVAFPGLHTTGIRPYVRHEDNWDTFYAKRVWTGYAEKWGAVAEFYDRLSRNGGFLEELLSALHWSGTKSWTTKGWHEAEPHYPRATFQTSGWSGIVLDTYAPSRSRDKSIHDNGLTYVEVGHLWGAERDFIYVVNRRAAPADTIDISIRLSFDADWELTDGESPNRTWAVNGGQWFTDRFIPGGGKLYSITSRNDSIVTGPREVMTPATTDTSLRTYTWYGHPPSGSTNVRWERSTDGLTWSAIPGAIGSSYSESYGSQGSYGSSVFYLRLCFQYGGQEQRSERNVVKYASGRVIR